MARAHETRDRPKILLSEHFQGWILLGFCHNSAMNHACPNPFMPNLGAQLRRVSLAMLL